MFLVVASIVLFVVALVGLGFTLDDGWKLNLKQLASPFVFVIILLGMFTSIKPNHVGIIYNPFQNGVQQSLLQEGFKRKSPFEEIYQLSTEVKELNFSDISVQTSDSQWVDAIVQIQVRVDRDSAFEYFKKYKDTSLSSMGSMLKNVTQKELEAISTQYNVMDILGEKRMEVVNAAYPNLKAELAKDGIVLERLVLVDTDAGELIESAIAKEASAKKETEVAKYLKEKAELEGQAKVIEAQKEKEANEILTSSLTEEVMGKMKIDLFMKKWDGKLPAIMGGNGAEQIIDITSIVD